MTSFPEKAYGICPLGHNAVASGTVNNATSTHQITGTEEVPLFWSNFYQTHICHMHIKELKDDFVDWDRLEKRVRADEFRERAGFVKTIS